MALRCRARITVARVLNAAAISVVGLSVARPAGAQDGSAIGAPLSSTAASASAPTTSRPSPAGVPVDEAIRLDEYLNRLDEWRVQGRITATESARARRLLYAAVAGGDRGIHVPLDASGRIDLLALARGQSDVAAAFTRPADRLVARVVNEFDIRMRLKPRDLASPGNLMVFDAAPGYVGVPARDLSRIVKGALETTTLAELPGGTILADAIDSLPNVAGTKSTQTIKEVSRLVGDRQEDWFRSRMGSFVAGHRLEAGLIAFGAVTALRMASRETALAIDRFRIRLRIARRSTRDARLYTTTRLIYRNGYVLPELELESGARHASGSMTLRATVAGTMGAEASQHARGRVAMGARWERGRLFADTNAMYAFPEHLTRTELRGGYLAETGFGLSGALAATFGRGSGAVGGASGRLAYELDVTKMVLVGRAQGETGLFISTSADSDFTHTDARGGLMFRLRF